MTLMIEYKKEVLAVVCIGGDSDVAQVVLNNTNIDE